MSPVWLWLFWAEIPLMGLIALSWFIFPFQYLHYVLAIEKPRKSEYYLLILYAGTVLSLAAYYAFLLATVPLNSLYFLVFQIVLCVGDVYIVVASLIYMVSFPGSKTNWFLLIQILMATVWAAIRMMFIPVYW